MAGYVSEYRQAFGVPLINPCAEIVWGEPQVFIAADIAPYLVEIDKAIAMLAFVVDGGNVQEIRTVEEFYGVTHE